MCRLDSKGSIRISDFGLSEDIYTSGYYRQNMKDAVRLTFKWMPPESLRDAIFSSQSDVVSHYEIDCNKISFGSKTYYVITLKVRKSLK